MLASMAGLGNGVPDALTRSLFGHRRAVLGSFSDARSASTLDKFRATLTSRLQRALDQRKSRRQVGAELLARHGAG